MIDRDLAIVSSRLLSTALAEVVLSTVVAAVVWLVSRLLRGRWPAFEHGLWLLVLVRLVRPPGLAHPLGAGALLDRIGLGIGGLCGRATEPAALWDTTAGVPDASPAGERPRPPAASPPAPSPPAPSSSSPGRGSSWPSLRDSARARAWRRVLARASAVSGGAAARLAERGRRRLGIRRALCAALGHELAHVARWDMGWIRLERWVERFTSSTPSCGSSPGVSTPDGSGCATLFPSPAVSCRAPVT